jgi:hypothetical protein
MQQAPLQDSAELTTRRHSPFFLPFWYEHILDMQLQDRPATLLEVANIMGSNSTNG